jgi:hypothetical protein
LAGLFPLAVLYAMLVRWASKKKLVGQTAWAVAIGVSGTLLAMVPALGLEVVAIIFCYFAVAGIPMIVEYVLRVHNEQRNDEEKAKGIARDLIGNDEQA